MPPTSATRSLPEQQGEGRRLSTVAWAAPSSLRCGFLGSFLLVVVYRVIFSAAFYALLLVWRSCSVHAERQPVFCSKYVGIGQPPVRYGKHRPALDVPPQCVARQQIAGFSAWRCANRENDWSLLVIRKERSALNKALEVAGAIIEVRSLTGFEKRRDDVPREVLGRSFSSIRNPDISLDDLTVRHRHDPRNNRYPRPLLQTNGSFVLFKLAVGYLQLSPKKVVGRDVRQENQNGENRDGSIRPMWTLILLRFGTECIFTAYWLGVCRNRWD